jgi:predicted hydrocarbon binding protein
MSNPTSIFPLLESVVQDNPSYKFPIEFINKELTNMFLEPLEFEYFRMMAYRNLKKEYGDIIAHIFLQLMEIKLELQKVDIYTLPVFVYQSKMEDFLSTLENLYITRIDKNSPDGEMLIAMV